MSQTYTTDLYDASFVGGVTLGKMEENFAALKSCFSGSSSPGNPVAGMLWFDTGNEVLKSRNAANSNWYTQLQGTSTLILWVYANTVEDGWVLDSSVTDKLLAIKGGSTYTTGAATAGSWTWPSYTLTIADIPSHRHGPQSGYANFMSSTGSEVGGPGDNYGRFSYTDYVGGDGGHSHGGTTFRPYAAVGTMQYPVTT